MSEMGLSGHVHHLRHPAAGNSLARMEQRRRLYALHVACGAELDAYVPHWSAFDVLVGVACGIPI